MVNERPVVMDDGRLPRLNRTFKRRRPFLCLLSFGRSKRKYEHSAKESKIKWLLTIEMLRVKIRGQLKFDNQAEGGILNGQ